MQDARLRAEVRASEYLDGVVVLPGRGVDPHAVVAALREGLPHIPLRRTAAGVKVPAHHSQDLLAVGGALELQWDAEARRFADNRRRARLVHARLKAEVAAVVARGPDSARRAMVDLDDAEVLDDHQAVNVAAMALADSYGLCLFDEQGTGKTISVIFAFDLLAHRDQVDVVVIVAPKSMVGEWPHDFERFRGDLYRVMVVAGGRSGKRAALATPADVYVTNYETAVSMEAELRGLLRRYGERAMLIVDESFFAKNLGAKRTRALRRLREWCGRCYVLCGTPAPNSPHDLVQQMSLVDFGIAFDGIQLPENRSAAIPAVRAALEDRGLFVRHLKADVLPNLPPRRFQRVLLPLAPQQEALYAEALTGYLSNLRRSTEQSFRRQLGSFLARRTALLQLCSNPRGIVPGYTEVPAKLRALDGLLEELVGSRREKVVLWSFYTASLEALFERYGHYGAVRYDGAVSDVAVRRDAVSRFQEDDDTMLFVGNPAAAGAGLTLHRARYAVYESLSNQAVHYLQSLDRVHRRGQTRPVEYVVLLCNRTLEVTQFVAIGRKEVAAKMLLGDPQEAPPTRELMLREAEEAVRLLRA